MKTDLKLLFRSKWFIMVLLPLPLLLAEALFPSPSVQHTPGGNKGHSLPAQKNFGVEEKIPSRLSPSGNLVLTPISLLDEAFTGYDLQQIPFTGRKEAQKQKESVEGKGILFGMVRDKPAEKVSYQGTAAGMSSAPEMHQERIMGKGDSPTEVARSASGASVRGDTVDKHGSLDGTGLSRSKSLVLKPISLLGEVFSGYDSREDSFAEKKEQEGTLDGKSAVTGTVRYMPAATGADQKKAIRKDMVPGMHQERIMGKGDSPREVARSATGAVTRSGPDDKVDSLSGRTTDQDEDLKLLNERATEAGLTEANKKKIIQSYRELCKVLPKSEAQKMILWKVYREANHGASVP